MARMVSTLSVNIMVSKPRNRIVVFRLSHDEYRSLKEACDRRGARNVSDFTRTEILESLRSDTPDVPLHRRFEAIEQGIASLQSRFDNLLHGVLHVEPKHEQ